MASSLRSMILCIILCYGFTTHEQAYGNISFAVINQLVHRNLILK